MSSSDQPAASGPKLFNRLKKSLSGQNLSKANQDAQNGTQDVDVQDTVTEEAKGEEKEGVDAVEKDNDTEASAEGGTTVEHTVTEDTVSGKASDDAADSHTAEDSIQSASEQEPVHKKEKVTGLQRLKSLTKFSKGGHRSAKPSEHTAQTPTGTITEGESEITTQQGDSAVPVGDAVTVETGSSELGTADDVEDAGAQPTREASDASGLSEGDEKYNDPASLADIIRNLVESLPHPTEPAPVPSKPKLPQLDTSGRPILPPDSVHVDDKKLIAKLRNPAIMNGKNTDAGEGEEKPTVFAVLDSFKAPSADAPEKDKDGAEDDGDAEDGEGDEDDDEGSDVDEEPPHVITDDSSVMIYIPLIPTKKSKVEMAKCDIVPVNSGAAVAKERLGSEESNFVDVITTYRMYGTFGRGTVPPVIAEGVADGGKVKENAVALPRFSWKFWPWKKKPAAQPPVEKPAPESGSDDKKPEGDADKKPVDTKPEDGKPVDDKKPTDDKAPVGDKKPASDDDKKKKRPHKLRKPKPILDQRVWIPSNQHVSVQALWWGYRIFLPPPVMSILSDKSIEAVKRAALITTALTWMFSHLPLKMFPAPMQPALMMLQALVPYLGYIGTFISWSWGAVKSYDLGYGVILSATWILPVALIPGSWQAYDFPSTNPPTTTPGSGTPTQPPATGTPAPPTQPSTGTPAPAPANPAPTTPSGSLPPVQNAPLEPPMTIGTSAESADSGVPPTMSKRLRLVKGEGSPADEEEDAELDPTMTTRLKMVKGEGTKPSDPTMSTMLKVLKGVGEPADPTMSTRLRMVKGEGVPGDEGGVELDPTMSTRLRMVKGGEATAEAEAGKSGYGGLWSYLSGSG
ncbi:hypothetical protein PQX77_010253 [Marasmius sp. AFHP31]|nr:hypothetical protein PQX77_010253 [Marasmius sp. AFHP31]